jgi:integrase
MARRSAIFEGTYQPRRRAVITTISDFAPRFLQAKRHLRTSRKYRQQIEQYLGPHFSRKPLEAITGRDCLDYYNSRLDAKAAISTVNGEMACLKSLFSEAIRADVCQTNPAKGVKLLNPNNVRDRILSDEETARLFNAANEFADYIRPLFYLLYNTGMRLGEALALEWADIQPEHARIVIRVSKSGEGRKVPLRQVLSDELIRWKPVTGGSRWVFPGRYDHSKPMNSIRPGWVRLCAAAEINDFHPHDLRHNFTSLLQAQGVSDSIIMSITGHKTHVMLHRYSHSNDSIRLKAVDGLPVPETPRSEKVIPLRKQE